MLAIKKQYPDLDIRFAFKEIIPYRKIAKLTMEIGATSMDFPGVSIPTFHPHGFQRSHAHNR